MSGHSKWATIKHKKAATDAKRGKIFSKIAREITISVKQSGGDPSSNITLRSLIQKGKAANMPSDNIDRAIKKGTGELEGGTLDEVTYEAFVGGGVGVIVQVVTDNRNRSAAEVRHVFTRHSVNMGAQGSVSRNFQRKGQIHVDPSKISEDRLMEVALEAGADDLQSEDGQFVVTTSPASFPAVCEALNKAGVATDQAEITMVPDLWVTVSDKNAASTVMKFVEALEDLEDVQNVYTNMDVDDAVLKELEKE